MQIKENMLWPPMNMLYWKMAEHSAWYSGDPTILANFYAGYTNYNFLGLPHELPVGETFWGRAIKNKNNIVIHVPIAADLAETSSNFLFSESPRIKVLEANEANASSIYKTTQEELDNMLLESMFYSKILEAAETCAGIGGIYIKIAWDQEISEYPIPVVEQADKAIPEFKFGILQAVTFWKNIKIDKKGNRVYRLLERYEKGLISYTLYEGSSDRLGNKIDLKVLEETKDLPDTIETVDELLVVYIPNILPNRLDRNACLGRSDYLGIEMLMDSLDQVYSSWMKDIVLAQGRILLPESWFKKQEGVMKFNVDKSIYVQLDIDPVSVNGEKVTAQQFDIRAEQFEKTSLNLLERIITSAGYSPQTFGLNIEGRAESGTALSMRERKSFSTKNKKEQYWGSAIKRLVQLMLLVYSEELGGNVEVNSSVNIEFSDAVSNNMNELSTSVKMLADAIAISTETKVRMLHDDWDEEQVLQEVEKIKEENGIGLDIPEGNLDIYQQMMLNNPINEPEGNEDE